MNFELDAETYEMGMRYKEKMMGYLLNEFKSLAFWIKNFFFQNGIFNRMLVLYGPSQIGKTSFHNILFPRFLFPQITLTVESSRFSDPRAYDPETVLWIHSDLNESLTKNNLFYL